MHAIADGSVGPGNIEDARSRTMLRRILGADILTALEDPHTIEVTMNPDGRVWHERLGQQMRCIGQRDPAAAMSIIRTLAGAVGAEITRTNPLLECELPLDGSRVAAQVPPIVEAPTFAIRKHASRVFTLSEYVESETMTVEQADAIRIAVAAHHNILVVGGTGSGKTTLTNAVIHEMVAVNPDERIVSIEDTRELQCNARNKVAYRTSKEVDLQMLLRATLRMRPDRILVGEVRGAEALDLLLALSSGHPGGIATLHADTAALGLRKLEMYISMNPQAPRHIEPLVAGAVNMVIHTSKTPKGRRVREILSVSGYENGSYQLTRSH